MALKFYFDTHIAKAIAVQLRAQGVNVVRCEEVEMAEASDEEHLQYAADNGYVMVSQDADFIVLDHRWQRIARSHPGIMKVSAEHSGKTQISYVIRQLLFYAEAERAGAIDYVAEIAGRVTYL